MSPAFSQAVLLFAFIFLCAGCASQKTQTLNHPPTSSPIHGLADGQSAPYILEQETKSTSQELVSLHDISEEALQQEGFLGKGGEPGFTEPVDISSELPSSSTTTLENLPDLMFPDESAGPHALGAKIEPEVASVELPEDLAEPEFAGPKGIAGGSEVTLNESDSPTDNLNAIGLEETNTQDLTINPPSDGRESSPTETNDTLPSLLSWLKKEDSKKPHDPDGHLEDFANPGDALTWLLNRTATDIGTSSSEDLGKQSAVLDWLTAVSSSSRLDKDIPNGNLELANVINLFRIGAENDATIPDQDDFSATNPQIAHWLRHASNHNTNNNNSLDQAESGSNPMLKWLSQGRSNSITQNSKNPSAKTFRLPFKPKSTIRSNGETLGEPGYTGSFSLSGSGEPVDGSQNQEHKFQSYTNSAHGWLQSGATITPEGAGRGVSIRQATELDYSAAFGWFRRAASSWEGKTSPLVNATKSTRSSNIRNLTTSDSTSEALRWFQKANGQRKHPLHAARREDSGTDSSTTP